MRLPLRLHKAAEPVVMTVPDTPMHEARVSSSDSQLLEQQQQHLARIDQRCLSQWGRRLEGSKSRRS